MENSDKAKIIVSVIRQRVEMASNDHIRARADLASAEMGEKLWREEEDRSGNIGFSQCPYYVEAKQKVVDRTLEERLAREEVLAYAIEVFLSKI